MPAKIEVLLKDPSELSGDALLLPTNNDLILGSDSSSVLRRKASSGLQEECDKYAPVRLGEVIKTDSYGLEYKAILHLAIMPVGLWPDDRSFNKAMKKAVRYCQENGFKNVVIPNLEGETTLYSSYKGAKLVQWLANQGGTDYIENIKVACLTEKSYQVYSEVLLPKSRDMGVNEVSVTDKEVPPHISSRNGN